MVDWDAIAEHIEETCCKVCLIDPAEFARLKAENATLRKVRPAVMDFAIEMEKKLLANDHKGGWQDCTFEYLMDRLREETCELNRVMYSEDAVGEAADVANMAMMIADCVLSERRAARESVPAVDDEPKTP